MSSRAMSFTGLIALALLLIGCGGGSSSDSGSGDTVKVAPRTFSSAVAAVGAVKPQVGAEVRVGARISGRVERLHANIKDQVRPGQVIAELDKTELESLVARRRAELRLADVRLASVERLYPHERARAEADLARWEATGALATKSAQRQQTLLQDRAVSQEAADDAAEKLTVASTQLESARQSLRLLIARHDDEREQALAEQAAARATLATAEIQLSYATLTAPIGGVIGSVSTQEGETVAAGLNAPTFVTIVDLSRLMVEAYVDEVDVGKVQLHQRAAFTVDAFPAIDFEARVVAIYPKPTLQDNVVKYTAALEVTTPFEGKLRPEMTATVSILLEARTVLAIPARAVQRQSSRDLVYVAGTGRPAPREVKLGWKEGPWTEVVSGLKAGEAVLIEFPSDLKGTK
jgi:macrolide-specific efflux system membrane fusion protein